ncbi:MAG: PLDc N-terminal domain-containing protein [Actinomycetota bacterium]
MLLANSFGTGQVLWSILWFFLFLMWIWLVISIFSDIIRAKEMSGWAKAGWTVAIIIVPFIGVLAYLIFNGGEMADRSISRASEQEEAFRSYVQNAAGGASAAEQLEKLSALHDAGKLDDDEYRQLKSKLVSS